MVIHHLAFRSDRNSLASLLRVNKYVCSVTLPAIYADPFRLHPCAFFSKEDPIIKLLSLIKTLLLSLPEGRGVTDLLRVAYLSAEQHDLEYIFIPALKRFSLYGSWRMTTQVLQTLFSRVTPKIAYLTMSSCLGHDFPEWENATKKYLHELHTAHLDMEVAEEAIADAGLVGAIMEGVVHRPWYQLKETPAGRIRRAPASYKFFET
ncbi:MAG: hypothetical protein JOS17DRAFT_792826 [Linnemannia elongata]|nr:MAG: hypothetical protein JOS17DRAFT_792826 [Linnemannia elongata]